MQVHRHRQYKSGAHKIISYIHKTDSLYYTSKQEISSQKQFKMYPKYFILHLLIIMLAKCWCKFGKNSFIGLKRTAEVMKNTDNFYRRLYKIYYRHIYGEFTIVSQIEVDPEANILNPNLIKIVVDVFLKKSNMNFWGF